MKKLMVTLGLAAAVVSSLFATSPARAADEAPTLMPSMAVPGNLQLKPIVPLGPQYLTLFLPRAELISRVTVTPYPGQANYRLVYCKVSNIGHRNTGPFKTLVRIHRKFLPWLPAVTAQVEVPIWNIAPGGHQWIVLKAYAPFGITKAFSYADSTYVVKEYVESNNFDLWP
jgi:hypothetical protein